MRRITVAGVRRRVSRARAIVLSRQQGFQHWRERRGPHLPVDYLDWIDRRLDRNAAEFPPLWRTREDIPFTQPSRVAVLMHVFYPELVGQLLDELLTIPVDFDLVVTNASGTAVNVDVSRLHLCRNHVVLDVPNHGRDIWPSVQVVNAGLLDPYQLVLKVHTKRSAWREQHEQLSGTGSEWREDLLSSLLGSRANVEGILSAFAADPDLGIVTAPGNIMGPQFWGGDLATTRELLRRLELDVVADALRFAAGSVYWVRGFVLQGLRALSMTGEDFEPEQGHIDGTTAHAVERLIGILAGEAGLRLATTDVIDGDGLDNSAWQRYHATRAVAPRLRVVPFYLPQFHPIPENDRWWGTGFTEWANVTAARPVYTGHNQPNLPSELGFYDLRLDAVRQLQLQLANQHGIEGFMYYYYWFAGRRLLDTPISAIAAGDVDKPFCVMWANENWTRRWDGRSTDVLLGQNYDEVPATAFIDDMLPLLSDKRYMRIDDKAIVAVYRIGQIPDYPQVLRDWRRRAREAGVGELAILSADVAREYDGLAATLNQAGLDGTVGFPPHNLRWDWKPHGGLGVDRRFEGNLLGYQSIVADGIRRLRRLERHAFPGVMVTFDNTARRQWKPDVWFGSNPYTFRRWLSAARSAVAHRPPQERIVFVNAWNEWAEGAVLEPSRRFGRTYLQAVRDVSLG